MCELSTKEVGQPFASSSQGVFGQEEGREWRGLLTVGCRFCVVDGTSLFYILSFPPSPTAAVAVVFVANGSGVASATRVTICPLR